MSNYLIRPSGKDFGQMGLYKILGENQAEEVFTGTHEACNVEQIRLITLEETDVESRCPRPVHR